MKSFLTTLTFIFTWSFFTFGQIYNPVKWDHKVVETGANTYDVIFMAEIESGWYIYSQYLDGEDGPIPTSFNFDSTTGFELSGKNVECPLNRKEVFDKLFDMDLVKYQKKAIFRQEITSNVVDKKLTGFLEYMTCDEEKCLPPAQVDFELDLSKAYNAEEIGYTHELLCRAEVKFASLNPAPEQNSESKIAGMEQADSPVESEQTDVTETSIAGGSSFGTVSGIDPGNKIEEPVKWKASVSGTKDGFLTIAMDATIDEGWHIYSTTLESDDGPIRTNIGVIESEAYDTVGGAVESGGEVITGHDKVFDMEVTKLKKYATISQKVQVHDKSQPVVGYLEFMACNDSRCLTPQAIDFEVDPKNMTIKYGDELLEEEVVSLSGDEDQLEELFGLSYAELQDPIGTCVEKIDSTKSIWGIFVLGFLGGLLALLTPCVFPMIPLTVSFFTKSSEKKGKGMFNAVFYGFSILLVYVLISVPFHLLDSVNPNILNDISTNVLLNIAFFLIFLFFAFSFFGYFDLTLPSSVTNKVSAAEGIGGVLGIFFMALTLALVSFSCTGPILGSLLAGSLSSDGGAWELSSGFAGFGLALGLPFGLFAAFPSMMNKLPRSGGWLNTVKVVLGFIELALAFKFLSNADMVKQWGLLKIEPFLAIWILIALGLGLYLFGRIKFPHDGPIKKLSFVRIGLGALSFAFAIYLMSGFRTSDRTGSYQPLSLLSGLAPPVCYSILHKCKCPQGLECYKDLGEGLTYARSVNKPVLIDFTGHACVNCRKMEEHVWPEPEVYKYLKDDFVLISLYVDEKIALPEEDQVTLPMRSGGVKKMRNTGDRWSYFQTEYFNINSQPYYVLMTPDGQLLNNPVAYTPDKLEYAEFLECGLRSYEQLGSKEETESPDKALNR